MIKNKKLFLKSALLIIIPFFCLLSPLFFHVSSHPYLYSYDRPYLFFLFISWFIASTVTIITSRCCQQRQNYWPAFTLLLTMSLITLLGLTAELMLHIKFQNNFVTYEKYGHQKSLCYGFEAKPNHRWEIDQAIFTTDPFGFRTHPQDPFWFQKQKPRIFTLGGSCTFGFGLNDDETWPYLLENLLNEMLRKHPMDVINAGNNGHSSWQSLLRLYLKVLPWKPQYVIYYEAYNDIKRYPLELNHIMLSEDVAFTTTTAQYWARKMQSKNFYVRSMIYRCSSELFPRPHKVAAILTQDDVASLEGIHQHNGAVFIRNIRTMGKLCQADGIAMILTTVIHDGVSMPRITSEVITYYNRLLRNWAREENFPLIDLEKAFQPISDKNEYFYPDHYHPNKKGAQFIAKTIADGFLEIYNPQIIEKRE